MRENNTATITSITEPSIYLWILSNRISWCGENLISDKKPSKLRGHSHLSNMINRSRDVLGMIFNLDISVPD